MAKTSASGNDERRPKRTQSDRHPPTFRDRPMEAIISVLIIAVVGGLVAYGCTVLLLN